MTLRWDVQCSNYFFFFYLKQSTLKNGLVTLTLKYELLFFNSEKRTEPGFTLEMETQPRLAGAVSRCLSNNPPGQPSQSPGSVPAAVSCTNLPPAIHWWHLLASCRLGFSGILGSAARCL